MKVVVVFLVGITLSGSAIAGLYGLTHHSRANCGNNESISWDSLKSHELETVSYHVYSRSNPPKDPHHMAVASFSDTRRSAAVCWGEGVGENGWFVTGKHWMKDKIGKSYIAASETVKDCSIYDGWWDNF